MSSLIEKQQDFKGSINEVPFEREEVFDATASIVNAIEHRWPITCSKETIEAIKGYVEGHEAYIHPSLSKNLNEKIQIVLHIQLNLKRYGLVMNGLITLKKQVQHYH